ncbi:MAG: GlxA family transcriptional regulator [Pseudomonadota bacterium]
MIAPIATSPLSEPRSIGFLIVPDFSMVGFLCALSVFRIANQVAGRDVYAPVILAERAGPVVASIGIPVAPERVLADQTSLDMIFVCAGNDPADRYAPELGGALRRLARRGAKLGAISTGADLLARAGLLTGYRCTIYWEQAAAFAETFPDIDLTDRIYEIDRDRYTCGGATSAIDLCLRLVADDLGDQVAAAVSSTFVIDRVRDAADRQHGVTTVKAPTLPPALTAAIAAMEAHMDEPLDLDTIGERAGIGPRQLNRLFQQFLETSPADYYRRVRLTRAHQLITQTGMSVQDVAVACGFSSASHFSAAFRRQFGRGPRQVRAGAP